MKLVRKVLTTVLVGIFGLLTLEMAAQQTPMAPQQQQQQAQPEISDAQLESFVAASQDMNEVQQGAQQEMMKTIQDEGLDVNKFNEMAAQKQNPNQEPSMEITEEDQAAFDKAMEKVQSKQMEMQQQMESIVQDNGMEMAEYQQIQQAYQQDPELQQKVSEMMEKK